MDYGWPGNIRELKHVLERLVMFHPQRIDVENLPEEVLIPPVPPVDGLVEEGSFEEAMSAAEKFLLMKALERTGGNQREAARQLGMPASSLRSRLERHKLI